MPLYSLDGRRPTLPAEGRFWIAPNACLIGDVRVGIDVGIWFGAALRGDNEPIVIGARSNIQESCTLHTDMGSPLTIGEDCTIGHNVILHGCTIGEGSLIGMGSIVLNRARIGRGSPRRGRRAGDRGQELRRLFPHRRARPRRRVGARTRTRSPPFASPPPIMSRIAPVRERLKGSTLASERSDTSSCLEERQGPRITVRRLEGRSRRRRCRRILDRTSTAAAPPAQDEAVAQPWVRASCLR